MPRGKQVPYPVRNAIRALAWEGVGAAEIERELERKRWFGTYPVSLRTIQNVAKQARQQESPEPVGPWTLNDCDPEDVRLIRDVLALAIGPYPRPWWPSRALVQQMIRVRQAAPDIPADWALTVARTYHTLLANGEDARQLDMILVLRPWRDESTLEVFFVAVRCLRSQLGALDALRWVLVDLEVLNMYDNYPAGTVEIDDAVLMGPCPPDERRSPRTITVYPSVHD
jgi:hypothetical protein